MIEDLREFEDRIIKAIADKDLELFRFALHPGKFIRPLLRRKGRCFDIVWHMLDSKDCFINEHILFSPNDTRGKPPFGYTPLGRCIVNGLDEFVKELMDHPNIDVNYTGDKRCGGDRFIASDFCYQNIPPPIEIAVAHKRYKIMKLLCEDSRLNASKMFARIIDCHIYDPQVAIILCAHNSVDLNQNEDMPALTMAVCKDDVKLVEAMLATGDIDVNITNMRNCRLRTPINQAYQNAEMIELLLKANADVNARGLDGITPLMENVEYEKCLKVLLAAPNIDVNIRDTNGKTAYEIALEKAPENAHYFHEKHII